MYRIRNYYQCYKGKETGWIGERHHGTPTWDKLIRGKYLWRSDATPQRLTDISHAKRFAGKNITSRGYRWCKGPGEGRDAGKCKEISDRASLFSFPFLSLSFLIFYYFYFSCITSLLSYFFFVTTISPYIIPYTQTQFQIIRARIQMCIYYLQVTQRFCKVTCVICDFKYHCSKVP